MSYVDHIRVASIKNDLLVSPLSRDGQALLDRLVAGDSPVVGIKSTIPTSDYAFGDEDCEIDETYFAAILELTQRDLICIDKVLSTKALTPKKCACDTSACFCDEGTWECEVTYRLTWDMERPEVLRQ